MRLTSPGIVLRETKYQEADKILTVLTRDYGKQTVKARGCRRKNSRLAAGCQLLVYSELTLNEHGPFLTVTEADPLDQFWSLRQDLDLLALGSYFAEVCETTVQEGEESGAVLSLLLNSLYALDALHKPSALVKAAFELRLLCLTGYEPLLDGCAVCGAAEPTDARFDLLRGVPWRGRAEPGALPVRPGGGTVDRRGRPEAAVLLLAGREGPAPARRGGRGLSAGPARAVLSDPGLL